MRRLNDPKRGGEPFLSGWTNASGGQRSPYPRRNLSRQERARRGRTRVRNLRWAAGKL